MTITTETTAFRPGDEIRGSASWSFAKAPKSAGIRLYWHTQGKGDRDAVTVATHAIPFPQAAQSHAFTFTAPQFPYSFSGRLISLVWGLELVLGDEEESVTCDIVIAPDAVEIDLTAAELDESLAKPGKFPWLTFRRS